MPTRSANLFQRTRLSAMSLGATCLSSSAFIGGPFSPVGIVIPVPNGGTSPLNGTAAKTQTWVTLSSTGDTLLMAGSVDVAVSINAGAHMLPVSNYGGTVPFGNTNNGVGNATRAATLAVIPALSVTPTGGLSSAGDYGGPFTPARKDFTLTNAGNGPMNLNAVKCAAWLTPSAPGVTMAAGSNVVITATIDALAPAGKSNFITQQ